MPWWRSVLPRSAMWPRSKAAEGRSVERVFGLTWPQLPLLYESAIRLPRRDDLTADDELPRTVTSEQESQVFNRLGRVFKADDHYWTGRVQPRRGAARSAGQRASPTIWPRSTVT